MTKIILCMGDAQTPPRFWSRLVGDSEKDSEAIAKAKKDGYVESTCKKYLTTEQLNFLEARNE